MKRKHASAGAIFAAVLLFVATTTLTACDSGGEDAVDVAVVVGTYAFSQWTFAPNASAIADANVLDTLVAVQTSMRFTADRRFLLDYRFVGGANDLFISGTYAINGQQLDVRLDGSFDTTRRKLLLPRDFTLRVLDNGVRLEGSIPRNGVDLTEFSNRYAGVPPLDGTLLLQLRKR